jgi:hypothetical protein
MYLKEILNYTRKYIIIKNSNPMASGIKTFRFEFSKPFIQELSRFSKVHQYDERHTYKKEWAAWKSDPEIAEIMEMEKRRLEENGYTGNIEEKMFKSGRYYFRKKSAAASASASTPQAAEQDADADDDADDDEEPATPATPTTPTTAAKSSRKPYITMSKQCIKMMDTHITKHSTTPNFKPSSCYDNFYNENMASTEMAAEIEKIIEKYENVRRNQQPLNLRNAAQTVEDITNEIMDKIKKTYKNRYYRFVNAAATTVAATTADE